MNITLDSVTIASRNAEQLLRFYHDALGMSAELIASNLCALSAGYGAPPLLYVREVQPLYPKRGAPENECIELTYPDQTALAVTTSAAIRSGLLIHSTDVTRIGSQVTLRDPEDREIVLSCGRPVLNGPDENQRLGINDLLASAGPESQPIPSGLSIRQVRTGTCNVTTGRNFYEKLFGIRASEVYDDFSAYSFKLNDSEVLLTQEVQQRQWGETRRVGIVEFVFSAVAFSLDEQSRMSVDPDGRAITIHSSDL